MALSDLEILARLIQCEAGGEGENGMQAVASVIMNRVHITYGEYGRFNTIREVVFQQRQFVCAMETVTTICKIYIICVRSKHNTILPIGQLQEID